LQFDFFLSSIIILTRNNNNDNKKVDYQLRYPHQVRRRPLPNNNLNTKSNTKQQQQQQQPQPSVITTTSAHSNGDVAYVSVVKGASNDVSRHKPVSTQPINVCNTVFYQFLR
jgi:hypothetical protein